MNRELTTGVPVILENLIYIFMIYEFIKVYYEPWGNHELTTGVDNIGDLNSVLWTY